MRYGTAHFLSNIYINKKNTIMTGGVLTLTGNPWKRSPKLTIIKILNNNLLFAPFNARIPLVKLSKTIPRNSVIIYKSYHKMVQWSNGEMGRIRCQK